MKLDFSIQPVCFFCGDPLNQVSYASMLMVITKLEIELGKAI